MLTAERFGRRRVISLFSNRLKVELLQILPESLACRLYILTVLVQTAIDLAIEGDLLIRFNQAQDEGQIIQSKQFASRKMPVYLSVFALAQYAIQYSLFKRITSLQYFPTGHGHRSGACTQHVAIHLFNVSNIQSSESFFHSRVFYWNQHFNALFLAYAIIQIGEIKATLSPTAKIQGISHIPIDVLTTIIPIVISVAELAYIALGWKSTTNSDGRFTNFLERIGKSRRCMPNTRYLNASSVRYFLLGWFFGAVYLACTSEERLGVLCDLCSSSVVAPPSCRGPSGRTTRKQVDDDYFHVGMHWCHGVFYIQGTPYAFLSNCV
jgi:hypothetical protein